MPHPEPHDRKGSFARLMAEIRTCKRRRTCRALRIRALYFEPNTTTVGDWRAGAGDFQAYAGPIDRRVMFICESPGGQAPVYNSADVRRCWALTAQDRRFYTMRRRHGFENCYLTNSVKCGIRRGSRHTDKEMDACGGFLARELELVAPMVAVGVGNNAMFALHRVARGMKDPPVLFQITHYSARRGKPQQEWPHEMTELLRLLARLKPRSGWSSGKGER